MPGSYHDFLLQGPWLRVEGGALAFPGAWVKWALIPNTKQTFLSWKITPSSRALSRLV